jgi:subtilisin-like proprotein convertase family protein
VADALTIASISVSTVLSHPYRGDLVVTLIGPDDTSVILHDRSGGSADDVTTTFAIATAPAQPLGAFTGRVTAGSWRLARPGTWRRTTSARCTRGGSRSNGESSATPSLPIPDNDTTGVTSTQNVTRTGTVSAVQVRVDVTHSYRGDLEIALIGPDGTTVLLHNRTGGSANDVQTEYPDLTAPNQSLAAFTGRAIQGAWRLRVRDLASDDVGTLVSWVLSLH